MNEQFKKIAALLDSPEEGERGAALHTANAWLKRNGKTWRDVLGNAGGGYHAEDVWQLRSVNEAQALEIARLRVEIAVLRQSNRRPHPDRSRANSSPPFGDIKYSISWAGWSDAMRPWLKDNLRHPLWQLPYGELWDDAPGAMRWLGLRQWIWEIHGETTPAPPRWIFSTSPQEAWGLAWRQWATSADITLKQSARDERFRPPTDVRKAIERLVGNEVVEYDIAALWDYLTGGGEPLARNPGPRHWSYVNAR